MFGSIGWGVSMFLIGIALDNSISFTNHPCEPQRLEKNYTICFASFSILMGAALVIALQIPFPKQELFSLQVSINFLHQIKNYYESNLAV